jgi:hypothetical protein
MRCFRSFVPRCARRRWWGVVAVVLAAGIAGVAPGVAVAQQCQNRSPSYTDACGPTFVVPAWGDGGGWTDASKYSTIQLADFNGDGRDELLARNDQGLEIFWFDTTLGQWSPQVDAKGIQQVLSDFRSPVPSETPETDWTKPQYYSTIQTAHINGNKEAQILARFADGMRVYYFSPGPGGSINGGSWSLISQRGPFSDADGWNDPSLYTTIRTADLVPGSAPTTDLIGRSRNGLVTYSWNGGGWSPRPVPSSAASQRFSDATCGLPSCYGLFRTVSPGGLRQAVFGRPDGDPAVMEQYDTSGGGGWSEPRIVGFQPFSDTPGAQDCPFPNTSDCLGSSPSYYETFGTANLVGDGSDELFARGSDGLRVKSFDLEDPTTYDDQGGDLEFVGGWTTARNVPGAINGTETSSGGGLAGRVQFDKLQGVVRVQVIGPVGPGLGTFAVVLGRNERSAIVDQSAPRRREQQVLFEAEMAGITTPMLTIAGPQGTVVIDAIRTYTSENRAWSSLPTLGALAGSAQSWASTPGRWASLRTGDVDGDGADEVLALDGNALQAWSLRTNAWTQLPASPPLALTGDWLTKPEYYATIRVGDVDGDGRDDVVARGQYGIRTWFYDRRGTGGWERYLDNGYQAFPGTATTGQQGAFNKLNDLALARKAITAGKIRDLWTGENRPDPAIPPFSTILTNLAGPDVGNCSGETILAPPTYASCALPADMTGYSFTAADWTAVVNELLREAYLAQEVVGHFDDLETIRQNVFEGQDGEMAAIGADLQLAAAAGNTTDFNLQSFFAGLTGVTASIAGVAAPEVSAGLWVASEVLSMLPSASETANSSFQTTYAGLLDKMATARSEMQVALKSQSQQVRVDQGLLGLVGQLRSQETWVPNVNGIENTGRMAFVLETYKALVPTVFDRYQVTNCIPNQGSRFCEGPSPGPGVIGNSQNFTTIGLPPTTSAGMPLTPCIYHQSTGSFYCHYETNAPPADLMTRIWGPIDPGSTCDYEPGNANSAWTFGCNLAVPQATSIGSSPDWAFATHSGNPVTLSASSTRGAVRAAAGVVRASAAQAGSSAQAARNVLAPLRFTGRVFSPRGLRLRRMRVSVQRTLFEHGRREELARSRSGRRLRRFALRRVRAGLFTSGRRGRPGVRLRVRRLAERGGARLDLRLTRVRTRDIRALCTVLPASISRAGRPLELETRLRLRDGKATQRITLRQRWRCVRDRKGEFTGIRPIKLKPPAARPGLAVRLRAPHVLPGGRRAAVRVTVTNRRRARPSRVVSSLWDLRITGRAGGRLRTTGLHELRAGRSRTVRLTVPVPRHARGRACVRVSAKAPGARGAVARSCARVTSTPP